MLTDDESNRTRYVDAADFGLNPVAWVVLVYRQGHVILTVEGVPFARVEPLEPAIPPDVIARSRAPK